MIKNTIESSVDIEITESSETIASLRGHLVNNGYNVHNNCSLTTLKNFILENSIDQLSRFANTYGI